MKLNKTSILALKILVKAPQKTSDLATSLALSKSRTSTLLNQLVRENLVIKKGWQYSIGKTSEVMMLTRLIKNNPSLAVENILTPTELSTLRFIHKKQRTVAELSKETQKTPRRVYYTISLFRSMDLITNIGAGKYIINKKHPAYADINAMLTGVLLVVPAFLEVPEINVAWSGENEYIIKTRDQKKTLREIKSNGYQWKYTSTSAVGKYGIKVIPPQTHIYIYLDPKNLKTGAGDYATVEDSIIHVLLEKNRSAKEYIKWLICINQKKIDLAYLRSSARKYNILKDIEDVLYEIKPILDPASIMPTG